VSEPADPVDGETRGADVTTSASTWVADAPNRLVAFVLDALFLTAILFVLAIVMSVAFGAAVRVDMNGPDVSIDRGRALTYAAVAAIANLAYFVWSWRRSGATPGMRLLRTRLRSASAETPIGVGAALVRWAFVGMPFALQGLLAVVLDGTAYALVTLLVLVWYLVLLVSVARDRARRGVHDRLAGTVVTKDGVALLGAPGGVATDVR